MSRRFKPGQRARIISGISLKSNRGKIVAVVRPYFGEKIGGRTWVEDLYPWVVTSLGAPLNWRSIKGPETGTAMTIVVDDCELEPLDDDDDGLRLATGKDKPRSKPMAKRPQVKVDKSGIMTDAERPSEHASES